jgi:cation diffusion facilitator CzcD-associated flavoprotein CzcO
MRYFDVVIIGAGLSGIDAAWHLQKYSPKRTYVILENRGQIGGTWDLFRYPGVRSDSDMFTMGYSFRPWTHSSAISPGSEIRKYIIDRNVMVNISIVLFFSHLLEQLMQSQP